MGRSSQTEETHAGTTNDAAAQAVGNIGEADRLLTQAQELDPDAVAEVLREHDAGRAPDARLQDLADQDVERVVPRITPGPALT